MTDRTHDPDVQRIAELLESGVYEVDALDVADAVLARWSMQDVIDGFGRYSADTETEADSSNP